MSAESERATKAASAYAQTVKLLQTAEKVLANPKTSMEERKKWLENLKMIGIDKPELTTAIQGADTSGISSLLAGEKNRFRDKSAEESQRAYVAKRDQLARARKELARLENLPTASDSARTAAKAQVEQASGQFVQASLDRESGADDFTDSSEKAVAAIEKQKMLLEAIGEIYHSFPAYGAVDKNLVETASLKAQIEADQTLLARLDSDEQSRGEAEAKRLERRRELEAEIVALREKLARAISIKL